MSVMGVCENKLSGTIPSQIGQLYHLRNLHLHDNKLTGESTRESEEPPNIFPDALPPNPPHSSRHDTVRTGTLPREIADLPLIQLFVQGNKLTGAVRHH